VDTHPDLHFALADVKVGLPAAGMVHGDSAIPIVRMLAQTLSAIDFTSSRPAISAASAPAIL